MFIIYTVYFLFVYLNISYGVCNTIRFLENIYSFLIYYNNPLEIIYPRHLHIDGLQNVHWHCFRFCVITASPSKITFVTQTSGKSWPTSTYKATICQSRTDSMWARRWCTCVNCKISRALLRRSNTSSKEFRKKEMYSYHKGDIAHLVWLIYKVINSCTQ